MITVFRLYSKVIIETEALKKEVSVFQFSARKKGTEYLFRENKIPFSRYFGIEEIKKKDGSFYTESEFDNFLLSLEDLPTERSDEEALVLWGEIGGSIENQSDLFDAFETKYQNRIKVINESQLQTIVSGTEYLITGELEIKTPIVIPAGVKAKIRGFGTSISKLYSSANNFTMISGTAVSDIEIEEITFEVTGTNSKVFDLKSQTGNEAFEMDSVNFENCSKIGILDNFRQGLGINIGYLGGKPEYEFRGAWNGFRISTAIIRGTSSGYTFWKAGTDFTFTGRFLTDINAVIPSGSIFCDFAASNITNDESLQFINADFNPGISAGTILPNISTTSTKVRVSRSKGVPNTYIGGSWEMNANTLTALTGSTPAKVAGTTIYELLSWLSGTNNNEFVSESTKEIIVEAHFNGSFIGESNIEYFLTVRKWINASSTYEDISSILFTTNGIGASDKSETVSLLTKNFSLNHLDRVELWISDFTGGGNDVTIYQKSRFKIREIQS